MEILDPFFSDQPPLDFVNELKKPFYEKKPEAFGKREKRSGEIDCAGVYLDMQFPDPEGLLETAIFDFNRFAKLCEIDGDRYRISLIKGDTPKFEAHKIIPEENGCTVIANDTEGIRRAIIYIEDEFMRREGAFLPTEPIYREPKIHTRITRGFFSPTNRPPKNGDELFDDIDYYPDEYLNRLAHDGTNGIWIYTSFRALMTSKYFPEYGVGGEKRIEKLRAVTKKCLRYGIKTYVFAMEPNYLTNEIAENHKDVIGYYADVTDNHSVCLSTEKGRNYILEATEKLCRLVPELGGYMGITAGERLTHCASYANPYFSKCPRCSKKRIGEMLAYAVNLIREGIRRAGTGAQYISWTYGHRSWKHEDIKEYVRNADSDIMLMQNFEEIAYPEQLGKKRIAVDYWLSYPGPSPMFEITAKEATSHGKHIFAKMQVCCSHELATVPYIPAPGLVFEKYKGANRLGVEGVLQCWYFGNYPSIMSKAAGELSFTDDFTDKKAFLRKIAATYYGESRADAMAHAFEMFEEGYINYPTNIMFSYYGPMHDGVVWELQLLPKDRILPRSWLLLDKPNGDRIHECLYTGHTLDEAITLSERMRDNFRIGAKYAECIEGDEMHTIISALDILFDSGLNILNFYKLRDELGYGAKDPKKALEDMRELVIREIENSEKMIPVCERDSRLGYHSEAEGFKFFPKKIRARIDYLKELLETEFVEVERRISEGKVPLEFYIGKPGGKAPEHSYDLKKIAISEAKKLKIPETDAECAFSIDGDEMKLYLSGKEGTQFMFLFEYHLERPASELILKNGEFKTTNITEQHQSLFGEKREKYISLYNLERRVENGIEENIISIKICDTGWDMKHPMRARVEADAKPLISGTNAVYRLGKPHGDPEDYIWLIPENIN